MHIKKPENSQNINNLIGYEHYKTVTDKIMLKIAELTGEEYPHIDEYKEEIEFK